MHSFVKAPESWRPSRDLRALGHKQECPESSILPLAIFDSRRHGTARPNQGGAFVFGA